jgi:hypothetical protein
MLATFFASGRRVGWATSAGLGLAFSMMTTAAGWAAETSVQHLRCTNSASGSSWQITVDLDHGTVDSQPAKITDGWISWPDPKQGSFDLERATGKLQFRNASSTGGYYLSYNCHPE